jgi:hypothetical protein
LMIRLTHICLSYYTTTKLESDGGWIEYAATVIRRFPIIFFAVLLNFNFG